MDLNEFVDEFYAECLTTGRFLRSLPASSLKWKPHERSMTAGQLAFHIATIPAAIQRFALTDTSELPDFALPPPQPHTLTKVTLTFEKVKGEALRALEALKTVDLESKWVGTRNGILVVTVTKAYLLRRLILNHWIHHRGQFGVYLRLLGAKVPHSYGPSADESPFD